MIITKEIETQVTSFMDNYWRTYLEGDIKTWATFLTDDYKNIGGTEEEIWNNKKEILDYTHSIIDQMVGVAELKNKKTEVFPLDPFILVHEFADMYIKIENAWSFYGKFRLSSVIQKNEVGYQVIHQHGSYPDAKTEQGEAFAFDKISTENRELKDAIKRRTAELENKTRELEIEASLERVRTVAMGMNKPEDMLRVCRVISEQLELLKVKDIRNVQTAIIYESKGTYFNYEYYRLQDKTFITEVDFKLHPAQSELVFQMKKGPEAFFTKSFSGEDLQKWYAYQKTTTQFVDEYLADAPSINWYFYSMGEVALGVSTYSPLNEEQVILFKRFRNVFEMAYRRFLDIEKAAAQAREAQIELALERVRARTMAMQHSEELQDTSLILFQQLKELGEPAEQCTIGIVKESEGVVEISATLHGTIMQRTFRHKLDEPFVMNKIFRGWKDQQKTLILEIKEEELQQYNQYRNELVGTETFPVKLLPGDRWIIHVAYFSKGMLALSTNEPRPAESLQLLERFAIVFEQTYTRFLDLQKAEAQTREAQIELALERVRAAAMAMHKSDELLGAVKIMFEEFQKLNLDVLRCGVGILNKDSRTGTVWVTSVSENGLAVQISANESFDTHPLMMRIYEFWQKQKDLAYVLQGQDLIAYYRAMDESELKLPKSQVQFLEEELKPQYYYAAMFNAGGLYAFRDKAFTAEDIKLIKRFANVLNLTYNRFLDLQKAEAQARDAQIEAALERVRSRTMGMQKSEELKEVIQVVYEQFVHLNINIEHTGFVIDYKARDNYDIWIADPLGVPSQVIIPYFDSVYYNRFNEAKEKGEDFFATNLSFEEKNKFYQKLFEYVPGLPADAKKFYFSCPGLAASTVLLENVCLYIENFSGIPYTDEENDVLMRFGKVFQQTYTRFLDLQKAEAQTHEAQIQLALERVRARTMAMKTQYDLLDVIELFGSQLISLGLRVDYSSFINGSITKNRDWELWGYSPLSEDPPKKVIIPYIEIPYFKKTAKNIEEYERTGNPIQVKSFTKEEKNEFLAHYWKFDPPASDEAKNYLSATPGSMIIDAFLEEVTVSIVKFELEPYSEEQLDIFKRFSNEFRQTYIRFLDLQKAEAQAREAKIEAALERTRTQSMLMQHSNELNDVSKVFHQQLLELHIETEFSYLWLPDEPNRKHLFWATWAEDENGETNYFSKAINYDLHKTEPATATCFSDWESGVPVHVYTLAGDEMKAYFETWKELLSGAKKFKPEFFPGGIYYAEAFMKYGCFGIMIHRKITAEEQDILRRFSVEFERAYTRFLDLKKAEAQARESEIQLALERVRARSLAMHHTSELQDVVDIVAQQLYHIGMDINGGVFIAINEELNEDLPLWAASGAADYVQKVIVPFLDRPIFTHLRDAIKRGNNFFEEEYSKVEKDELFDHLFRYDPWSSSTKERKKELLSRQGGLSRAATISRYTSIAVTNHYGKKFTDEDHEILKRFGNVFEQSYTRFLDLQKAEAQAREAQVEASLERVRTRAMAMHSSDELGEAAILLYRELQSLGIRKFINCGYVLIDEKNNKQHAWMTHADGTIRESHQMPLTGDEVMNERYESWKRKDPVFHQVVAGNKLRDHLAFVTGKPGSVTGPDSVIPQLPDPTVFYCGNFSEGYLHILANEELSIESTSILSRFTNVFEITYRRFLDLQKAEEQARESQIEAALERVRSRTLAMHKSDELAETSAVLFQQLIGLGIEPNRLYITIIKDDAANAEFWITDEGGCKVSAAFETNMNSHATFKKMYNGWKKKNKTLVIDMKGDELQEYFKYLASIHVPFKGGQTQTRRLQYIAYFNKGFIGMASPDEQPEETIQLLERFSAVFNLTFTRFNDLQIAEAQTKKANIEVALERVRARALAMQQPEELVEVAEVMRYEMGILGVEELETSSIYINRNNEGEAECWYALKNNLAIEKKMIADHFNLNYNDTWVGRQMLEFYNSNEKEISIVMAGQNRKEWINYCAKQSPVFEGFYGDVIPDRTYHLCKFSNGAIGAATPADISEESRELLRRAASVFSLAYSRFKDLTKARTDLQQLKEEKNRAETALTELQLTQKQLIQSEKMASLGELTAGIAHEIQNPLNFVNNFSEVSKELLDEMYAEIDKGNMAESKAIAIDIKQNLEKINHHGKRADTIVKGMLQHSRSSSAVKKPTDINALADEYLRLAYHGLRAKDKSFNATLKTDFEESIGNINIIPQDIGRVILNLITNAFYAVDEKKKSGIEVYEPTVFVSTRKEGNHILISVKDNGNGIPQKNLDKIFQPFFTTKPTGQGTGLGLSLSYDIVKAHGGELKVETKYVEDLPAEASVQAGSEFIIQLPND